MEQNTEYKWSHKCSVWVKKQSYDALIGFVGILFMTPMCTDLYAYGSNQASRKFKLISQYPSDAIIYVWIQ